MHRRSLLAGAALAGLGAPATVQAAEAMQFPRDFGSHPASRTEWWYITGHARAGSRQFGFQVTFFRSRVDATQGMKSDLAARQLVFAHAALTDVQGKKLWHDQRIARDGLGIAGASTQDTDVRLRDWSLVRKNGVYSASIPANAFSLQLHFRETQEVLLQGDKGLSRKGPDAGQTSRYYSLPHLAVAGSVALQGQRMEITAAAAGNGPANAAWLDHEWSDELLHKDAVGWDWIGMNLFDGSALTAFRLRDRTGGTLWDGGSFRSLKGGLYVFSRGEAQFSPQRTWVSPVSKARYPVEWIVRTPADFYAVKAVLDNQELDSRQSTGAIYWEGLSDLFDSNGKHVGRGYLEMTGYASALRL